MRKLRHGEIRQCSRRARVVEVLGAESSHLIPESLASLLGTCWRKQTSQEPVPGYAFQGTRLGGGRRAGSPETVVLVGTGLERTLQVHSAKEMTLRLGFLHRRRPLGVNCSL